MTNFPKFILKLLGRDLKKTPTHLTLDEARYFLSAIALSDKSSFQILTDTESIEIWHNFSQKQVKIYSSRQYIIAQKYLKFDQELEKEIIPIFSIEDLQIILNWICE